MATRSHWSAGEGRRRSLDGCDTVEDDVGTSELLVAVDPSRLHTITDLVDGSRALQKSDGVITVEAEVSYRAFGIDFRLLVAQDERSTSCELTRESDAALSILSSCRLILSPKFFTRSV